MGTIYQPYTHFCHRMDTELRCPRWIHFLETYIDYLYNKGYGYEPDPDLLENNTQKEYTGNLFAEVSKDFGEHFRQPLH